MIRVRVCAVADGPQTKALRASLRSLGAVGRDEAAAQLAKRYAALLDASAVPASYRRALDRLAKLCTDPFDVQALARVAEALSAHTIASDLGPKYLACLAQLGLTPAARGTRAALPVAPEPAPEPDATPAPEGKADELRQRRAARAKRRADGAG